MFYSNMETHEFTPEKITELCDNEVFVFGSNLAGCHAGGAAHFAHERFGAVWGQGEGLQGQSYAIPTMQGGVETIAPYVDRFIEFAKVHQELHFWVTPIGCGIAGFSADEIAPLFREALALSNVSLPESFNHILVAMQASSHTAPTWDADAWTRVFKQAIENQDYFQLHDLRIRVYSNTLDVVECERYVTSSGMLVELPKDDSILSSTRFYERELPQDFSVCGQYATRVEVVNGDCLAVARALVEAGEDVCVLNLANRQNPGGGVLGGCGAQEEYLFRCSDYFRSLYQFADYASTYGLPVSAVHSYPMDRNYGGVFSSGVTVFRDVEEKGYPLLELPWRVNMIAVAAINRPELEYVNEEPRVAHHLVSAVKNKMRTIFRIARENKQKVLVLGALGCGAFRNPPKHTAELFREVMQEPEFCGVFSHIFFAIKEDHNSRGVGNYAPFAEVFKDVDCH